MDATRSFTLLLCILSASPAVFAFKSKIGLSSGIDSFEAFQEKYGRTFSKGTPEFAERERIFELQLKKVEQHNSNPHRMWDAEINHLSDRTEAEFSQLLGWKGVSRGRSAVGEVSQHRPGNFLMQRGEDVLPEEVSWANLSAIQADTDQGGCGSCWAVATSLVLQANAEAKGSKRTFSPQEIVDCTPNPHHCGGTGGCAGSTVELAMNWIAANGLAQKDEDPYMATDGSCKKTSLLSGVENDEQTLEEMIRVGVHEVAAGSAGYLTGLRSWERLPENKYLPVLKAVATHGPVAISVAARAWSSYGSGLFDGCSKDAVIDHAVTLIGYGKDSRYGAKYWLVKNSWGNSWGEDGNIRMLRKDTEDSYCGTDNQPEVGTGCDGGPSEVTVCGMCGILYDTVVPHF